MKGEIETIWGSIAELFTERPRDNRFDPQELRPKGRAYVVREQDGVRGWDVMGWDVLGGRAVWPMTNVRNLSLPQWQRLAERPENRCLVPLTEFCEFTTEKYDLGDGKPPLKGEIWFSVTDQPVFAVGRTVRNKAVPWCRSCPNVYFAYRWILVILEKWRGSKWTKAFQTVCCGAG